MSQFEGPEWYLLYRSNNLFLLRNFTLSGRRGLVQLRPTRTEVMPANRVKLKANVLRSQRRFHFGCILISTTNLCNLRSRVWTMIPYRRIWNGSEFILRNPRVI